MNHFARITIVGILTLGGLNLLAAQPDATTKRYLDILLRKPANNYLFDRFYNEWLKHSEIEELEAFLKEPADKGDAAYTTLLAMFYEKEGRDDDAMKYLGKAVEKSSNPAELLVMRANMNIFANNPKAALSDLEAALKDKKLSDEKRLEIQKTMGRAYVNMGDSRKAVEVWQKVLAGTSDTMLREEIMELMISEGLTDQALELSKKLIESVDDSYRKVMLQMRQGEIYERLGMTSKTIEAYSRALEGVETGSWLERDILGRIKKIYDNENNTAGLLEYYNKLLETRKRDLLVMQLRAQAIYQVEGPEEGIAAYRKILEVTPGNKTVREQFARFLVSCGETTQAIKVFEELAQKSPKDSQIWLDLAKLYRAAQRNKDVAVAMKKYLACSDGSESAYLRTAKLLDYCNLQGQACEVLREMLKKYPKSVSGKESLAYSLHADKKDEQAVATLKELAATGDADTVIRAAEKLTEWKMPKDALEILQTNEKRFSGKSAYYAALGKACLVADMKDDAVKYFRRQLELADGFDEVSQVTGELISAAKSAGKDEELFKSLKGKYSQSPDKFSPADGRVLCELYMDGGDNYEASKLLADLLKKNPDSILLWTQAYQAANRNNDYTGAVAALKKLMALEPRKSGAIYRMLVDVSLRNNQQKQAMQYIKDWKRVASSSSEPWQAEARMYLERQDIPTAIATLRDAGRKFPDDRNIQELLVNYYTMAGKYSDARRYLWKLFEQAGDMSAKLTVVMRLASNASQAGTMDVLIRNFENRAKTDPRSVFPYLAMSKIFEVTGDYERRRDSLYKAFELSSENLELLHEIARLEEQEGEYARAIETLKKALAIDKTPKSRNLLIDMYMTAGEDEKGYAMLMEQMGEKIADAQQGLSTLDKLVKVDQIEQAASLGEQFVQQFPDDAGLKFYWGQVLRLADEQEKAADIFMGLLDYKDKAPATPPANTSASKAVNPYKIIMDSMPEGFTELQQAIYTDGSLTILANNPYGGGRYYISSYYGGYPGAAGRGNIYIPRNAAEMKRMAWNNLRGIYKSLDDAGQKKLVKKLSAKGIKYPEVYLTLKMNYPRNMVELDKYCKEYPEFKALQFLRYQMMTNTGAFTKAEFEKFDKEFGKDQPLLVLYMLVNRSSTSKNPEFVDIIISKTNDFRKMIKANPELSGVGLSLSYPFMRMFIEQRLNEQQQNEVMDFCSFCREIYKKVDPAYNPSLDTNWAIMMMASGKYDDAVKLFNDLASNAKKPKPPVARAVVMPTPVRASAAAKGTVPISQINFNSFPPPFRQMPISYYLCEPLRGLVKTKNFDKEKFRKAIEGLEDPGAKLTFVSYLSTDDADKKAKEMTADPNASTDALQAAAYWFAFRNQNDNAAELFEKVAEKTKDEMDRQYALGSIMVLVTSRNTDKKHREYIIEHIAELKPNMQQQWERERVVDMYRKLGQEKLVAKYTPKPTRPGPSHAGRIAPTRMGHLDHNKINTLIREGKTDKAAEELAKYFRKMCPKGSISGMRHDVWRLREVGELVKRHKIEKEFLKHIEPKADTTLQRMREYAMALESLGKDKEAEEIYLKIQKRKPRDEQANIFLAGYYAADDVDKAMSYLNNISVAGSYNIMSMKLYEIFSRNPDMSSRIGMMKLAIEFLKTKGKEEPQIANGIVNMLGSAGNIRYDGKHYSNFLHSKRNVDNFLKSPIPGKIRNDYISMLSQLCDVLSEYTGASTIFIVKQQLCHFYGEDEKQLPKLAIKLMSQYNNNPLMQGGYIGNRHFGSGKEDVFDTKTPCEYLLLEACKTGKWDDYDAAADAMSKVQYPQFAELVVSYRGLKDVYSADDASTPKKLQEWADCIDVNNYMEMQACNLLAGTWYEAGKKCPLTPALLKIVEKCNEQPSRGMIHNMSNTMRILMAALAQNGKSKEILELLTGLEKTVMPEDEIKRLNKMARTNQNYSFQQAVSSSQNSGMQFYASLVSQVPYWVNNNAQANMLPPLMSFISSRPYISDRNMRNTLRDYVRRAADSYEKLDSIGLLGDLDSYALKGEMFDIILDSLQRNYRNDTNRYSKILQQIKARKPQTFGSMLTSCVLSSDNAVRKELLNKYAAGILAMPKDKKDRIIKLLLDANVLDAEPKGLTPEVAKALADFKAIAIKEVQEEIKKHIAVANLTDPYSYRNETIELLNKCLSVAPKEFDKLFESSVNNIINSNYYSRNMSLDKRRTQCVRDMCSGLISSSSNPLGILGRMVNFALADESNSSVTNYMIQAMKDNMYSICNRQYNMLVGSNHSQENRLAAAQKVITQIEENFGPFGPALCLMNLGDAFSNCPRNELMSWLDTKARDTKQPRWQDYKVSIDSNWQQKNQQAPDVVLRMLVDDKLSKSGRICFTYNTLRNMDQRYAQKLYMPLAKLVAQQSDPGLVSWQLAFVASGDELDRNPQFAKKLTELIRKKYQEDAAGLQSDMKVAAFVKIACAAGDFDFAKQLLADRKIQMRYNNQTVYFSDMADLYVLLAKYKPMQEALLEQLSKKSGKLFDQSSYLAAFITPQDVKAFCEMTDNRKDLTDCQMAIICLMKNYAQSNETRQYLAGKMAAIRERYSDIDNLSPEELLDAVYYLRNENVEELKDKFVETAPFDKILVQGSGNSRENYYSNIIINYFNKYLNNEEDAEKVMRVAEKGSTVPYRANSSFRENLLNTISNTCFQHRNYSNGGWIYPPETYVAMMEKLIPASTENEYQRQRMARAMFYIYYLTGDEKHAREMIPILNEQSRNRSNNNPTQDLPYILLNIRSYEGKRHEGPIVKRLLTMSSCYSFPNYYARNQSTSFKSDMFRCLINRGDTRQIAMKLADEMLPELKAGFDRMPNPSNYEKLYSYYYALKDNAKMRAFIDSAIKKKPSENFFYLKAAEYYRNRRNYPKALEYCQLGLKNVQPSENSLHYTIKDIYRSQGQYEQAGDYIMKNYPAIQHGNVYSWVNSAADCYASAKCYKKAIAACEKVIELEKKDNRYPISEQSLKNTIAQYRQRLDSENKSQDTPKTGTMLPPPVAPVETVTVITEPIQPTTVPSTRPTIRVRRRPTSRPASRPTSMPVGMPGVTTRAAG